MHEMQAWRDVMLIAGVAILVGILASSIGCAVELVKIRVELEKLNRKK